MLLLSYQKKPVSMIRQFLAVHRGNGGTDGIVADADRVLGDGAGHHARPDRVLLGLSGIVTDDHQIVGAHFVLRIHDADCRASVRAEHALEVGVGGEDRLTADVDDADAVRPQLADDYEKFGDRGVVQCGGWLVHDHYTGPER
jgi:hypothetical protein